MNYIKKMARGCCSCLNLEASLQSKLIDMVSRKLGELTGETSINELIDILKSLINPSYDKVVYEGEKPYDVKITLADTDKLYNWFDYKPRYSIKDGLAIFIKNTII